MYVIDPVRIGTEQLPGGRSLGWAEWGPVDGVPVLFSPGAATSRHLGFGGEELDALGVRLISVDRPGLGASSPRPGRTFDDFVDDIRAFAGLRGLGRPLMVGNSQGAPFALACAAAGAVRALVVVSGGDEIAEPRFADALPGELRRLVDLAVLDPAAAEQAFAGFGSQAMWDMVMSGSPECDLAVYQQPHVRGRLPACAGRGLRAGSGRLRPGHRPGHGALGDRAGGHRRTRRPLVRGEGHRPLARPGAGLAMRIPGAVRHLVPEAGGAVLWTHAGQVLSTLLGRAAAA